MVSGKVKAAMRFQRSSSPATPKAAETPRRSSSSPANFSSAGKSSSSAVSAASSLARSFGVYFPKSSSQVQPKPPDVADLIRIIEELKERESRLRTQLLEQKILQETVSIVPFLESELDQYKETVKKLEFENLTLREEIEVLKNRKKDNVNNDECSSSSYSSSSSSRSFEQGNELKIEASRTSSSIPKPPPLPNYSFPKSFSYRSSSSSSTSSSNSSSSNSTSESYKSTKPVLSLSKLPPIPPPLPPLEPSRNSSSSAPPPPPQEPSSSSSSGAPPPPPPPPPSRRGSAVQRANVKREPEVVEFYHSLMRRDSKRESGGGASGDGPATAVCPRDMIGEIENRSTHLLAIKSDIETQGDFIKFLIKEVENSSFTKIEDVVSFVKWLDDELSCLVDERAVLKHFDWPEQRADALREAAFGYNDLKKLETDATSFRDDLRQPCSSALKKMQTLLEKLERGVYNVARMREGAMSRYKGFKIPCDWMQETGIVSQIKLASVKLAMKYMKRVSSELETMMGGPDEEELMLKAVRFAFRVHQFAGGFDVETMRAFQELKEKVSFFHIQNQNQQRLVGRSS